MIRFWSRELMGWLLILVGIYIIFIAISLLLVPFPGPEAIFEGPTIGFFGIMVFRGGIHLLKVAVAARVCMRTQADSPKTAAPEKRTKKVETPWDW
jgi:hypothetical protein